jgi:hypothetical protein
LVYIFWWHQKKKKKKKESVITDDRLSENIILSKRSLLCLVLQQVKAHLYVRRFQKNNIILYRYHKYKTSILSILWMERRRGKETQNTISTSNVIIKLSNHLNTYLKHNQ